MIEKVGEEFVELRIGREV